MRCSILLLVIVVCTVATACAETISTAGGAEVYNATYIQASAINQDPLVQRWDNGVLVWSRVYETTPVDGRAGPLMLDDAGRLWVAFSADGGSSGASWYTQKEVQPGAFNNVVSNSYGSGGGAKASIVAQINRTTGLIIRGTFIHAILTNGRTNTFNIIRMFSHSQGVRINATTAAWPPSTGRRLTRITEMTDADRVDGAFRMEYVLSVALDDILVAQKWNFDNGAAMLSVFNIFLFLFLILM